MLSCFFGYLFCSGSKNYVEKPTTIKSTRAPFGRHLFKPNFTRLGYALLDPLITACKRCLRSLCIYKCVSVRGGGGAGGEVLSQHALQVVSQCALQQVLGGGGGIPACLAGFQAHTQGGSLGGSGWGVSRPTPKGEVEGDLVQAHTQAGN